MKKHYKLSDKELRKNIFDKYNGKCAYCGSHIEKFHIDHIVPLNRNGSQMDKFLDNGEKHLISNLNPSCPACNISKSSFPLETWRGELQLKIDRIERDSSTFRNLKRFGLVGILKTKVVFYFETL
ncbi:MAG: HNH endonuclease [Bacteroidota bacterium]